MPPHPLLLALALTALLLSPAPASARPATVGPGAAYEAPDALTTLAALSLGDAPPDWSAEEWAPPMPAPPACASPAECRTACEGSVGPASGAPSAEEKVGGEGGEEVHKPCLAPS
jgi:hypothetical protein